MVHSLDSVDGYNRSLMEGDSVLFPENLIPRENRTKQISNVCNGARSQEKKLKPTSKRAKIRFLLQEAFFLLTFLRAFLAGS